MYNGKKKYLQLLLIITIFHYVAGFDVQLYEGSICRMEDGSRGVCKKILDCPTRLQQILTGMTFGIGSGHCGFSGHIQIVCCGEATNHPRQETPKQNTSQFNGKLSNPYRFGIDFITQNNDTPSTKRNLSPADQACREYRAQKQRSTISRRIAQGYDANQEEFDYTVALGVPNYSNDGPPMKYTCGGSLIAPKHVLTAAHCVRPIKDQFPVEVRIGSVDLREESNKVQHIPIENIIRHPGYSGARNYHDLAILVLKYPVSLNNIVPICLQTKNLPTLRSAAQPIIAAGWGATEFAGDMSPVLKRTPGLKLVDTDTCQGFYKTLDSRKIPNGITDDMLCAVDENEQRSADTCEGDSGGPLISMSNFPTLIGVTSFGQFCGNTIPAVYMAILPYLNWIENQVWP